MATLGFQRAKSPSKPDYWLWILTALLSLVIHFWNSAEAKTSATPSTGPISVGPLSVRINEWKFKTLRPGESLETQALATCVGLAVLDPVTHSAALTHLLYWDDQPSKSVTRAQQILKELFFKFSEKKIPLNRLQMRVIGGGFHARDFADAVLGILKKDYGFQENFENAPPTQLGGSYIRSLRVHEKGFQMERLPWNASPEFK